MRTIDADTIKYTMIYRENWMRGTGGEEQAAWKSTIDAMPTIEPERKKGKWKDCHVATYKYCCSECKAYHRAMYDYCPTCGADMRGEQ